MGGEQTACCWSLSPAPAKGKGAPAIHRRCALAAGARAGEGKETSKPSACRRAPPPCQIAIAEVGAVHSLASAERPVFRPPPPSRLARDPAGLASKPSRPASDPGRRACKATRFEREATCLARKATCFARQATRCDCGCVVQSLSCTFCTVSQSMYRKTLFNAEARR